MPQFRKKPVVIEAVQYRSDSPREAIDFLPKGRAYKDHLEIPTLEGTMRANDGDWIIKGIKGEFYPCKPDIFEATYEPV
jgi:hypothetical protein